MHDEDDDHDSDAYTKRSRYKEPFLAELMREEEQKPKRKRKASPKKRGSPVKKPTTPREQKKPLKSSSGKAIGKVVAPRVAPRPRLPSPQRGKSVASAAPVPSHTKKGKAAPNTIASKAASAPPPAKKARKADPERIYIKASSDGAKVVFGKDASLGRKKAMLCKHLHTALNELLGFLVDKVAGCAILEEVECLYMQKPSLCYIELSDEDRMVSVQASNGRRKKAEPFDLMERLPYYIATLLPTALEPPPTPTPAPAASPRAAKKAAPSAKAEPASPVKAPKTPKGSQKAQKAQKAAPPPSTSKRKRAENRGSDSEEGGRSPRRRLDDEELKSILSTVTKSLTQEVTKSVTQEVTQEVKTQVHSEFVEFLSTHSKQLTEAEQIIQENSRLREELGHLHVEHMRAEERARQAFEEAQRKEDDERELAALKAENEKLRQMRDSRKRKTVCVERCSRYPHGVRLRSEPLEHTRYKTDKSGRTVLVAPMMELTRHDEAGGEENGFTRVKTASGHSGWVRTSALRSRTGDKMRPPPSKSNAKQQEQPPSDLLSSQFVQNLPPPPEPTTQIAGVADEAEEGVAEGEKTHESMSNAPQLGNGQPATSVQHDGNDVGSGSFSGMDGLGKGQPRPPFPTSDEEDDNMSPKMEKDEKDDDLLNDHAEGGDPVHGPEDVPPHPSHA